MYELSLMNDGSVVFELNGAPDAVDMENILQQMSELSEGKQGMTMLYKISCFEIPSASAMMVKLSDLPRWIGVMKAFKKMAIVTEKAWIRNVAELEGFLIRGLEIKSFEFDEIHQAEAWLDEG